MESVVQICQEKDRSSNLQPASIESESDDRGGVRQKYSDLIKKLADPAKAKQSLKVSIVLECSRSCISYLKINSYKNYHLYEKISRKKL
jgi:hypothetical protein